MAVKSKMLTLVARWSIVALYNTCELKIFVTINLPCLIFPLRLGIISLLEFEYDCILVSVSYRGAIFFHLPNENPQLLGLI